MTFMLYLKSQYHIQSHLDFFYFIFYNFELQIQVYDPILVTFFEGVGQHLYSFFSVDVPLCQHNSWKILFFV